MDGDLRTYHGGCHCGEFSFSLRAAEITRGKRCNCSICVRSGAVMSVPYFPRSEFSSFEGLERLAVYHFGHHMVNRYFCPRCGIYTFHEAKAEPGKYRLNLGCIEGLDPLALQIEVIDGRSF
jgi:hypothetical protein